MKQIVKNQEPPQFLNWKGQGRDQIWRQVTRRVKQVVHDALMDEQGHICCYCESRVTRCNSHVEHFRPRSRFHHLELDYGNLHCSCQRELSRGVPRHCGHKKDNWFDAILLISPQWQNCDKRFKFNVNGEIRPRNPGDLAAKETNKRLGLDLPSLNARRAAAMGKLQRFSSKEIKALLVCRTTGFIEYFTTIEDVLL